MSLEDKHIEHLAKIRAVTGDDSWSSWSSPVGLIIFFIGMAVVAILAKYFFLMK